MNAAEAEALLRARGCTMTAQRRAILSFLEGNLAHPTATDVFDAVTRDHPMASKATVYNTLALLVEVGALGVLWESDREARYDPNVAHHHHAVCPDCGRIDDIPAASVEVRLDGRPTTGVVRFERRCPPCEVVART